MIAMHWPDIRAGWNDVRRTAPRRRLGVLVRVGGWDYRLGFLAGILVSATTARPRLRELAGNVDSISGDLERICDNLESITASLARLVSLAERVETAVTIPFRLIYSLRRL